MIEDIDQEMIGKKVHFKGYLFKSELYAFETEVVGKNIGLFLIDHPNGYPKEINGVKRLVVQVRKEDIECLT
jgi:hypothetical protein